MLCCCLFCLASLCTWVGVLCSILLSFVVLCFFAWVAVLCSHLYVLCCALLRFAVFVLAWKHISAFLALASIYVNALLCSAHIFGWVSKVPFSVTVFTLLRFAHWWLAICAVLIFSFPRWAGAARTEKKRLSGVELVMCAEPWTCTSHHGGDGGMQNLERHRKCMMLTAAS